MDDVIAIEVTLENGQQRYVVTWGRIQHPVDPDPVIQLVLAYARNCDLRGTPLSARVCAALREAADSRSAPYFFEALRRYSAASIPVGGDYEAWRNAKAAAMEHGKEIFFCGIPG